MIQDLVTLLTGVEDWSVQILAIVFSLGALMVYWLFYVSKLIPKWLALWGIVGAVAYLSVPILVMFGNEGLDVLMAPLAIQEMVLALWLIIRGFNTPNLEKTR